MKDSRRMLAAGVVQMPKQLRCRADELQNMAKKDDSCDAGRRQSDRQCIFPGAIISRALKAGVCVRSLVIRSCVPIFLRYAIRPNIFAVKKPLNVICSCLSAYLVIRIIPKSSLRTSCFFLIRMSISTALVPEVIVHKRCSWNCMKKSVTWV